MVSNTNKLGLKLVNIIRCATTFAEKYIKIAKAAILIKEFFIAATLISELDSPKDTDVIHQTTRAEVMLSVFPSLPRDE